MIKGIFLPHSGPPGLLVFPMLILSPLSFGAIFSLGTMRLLGGLLSGPSLELSLRCQVGHICQGFLMVSSLNGLASLLRCH